MTHPSRLLWLGALALAGCANCDWPTQPDQGPTPRPGRPVTVEGVGPGPVSVGPPGRRMAAKDCRNGGAKITLSGPAGANGLVLETAVDPPGVLTVDPVQIPAGANSARVEAQGEALGTATVRYRAPGQACDLARDCPAIQISVLAADGCMACAADEVGRGTYSQPVCRRDTFYLEAEWGSATPCAQADAGGPGFAARVAVALRDGVDGHAPLAETVCAWGAPECVKACGQDGPAVLAQGYQVRPEITPVLPDGDAAQGRFFRVQYVVVAPDGSSRAYEVPEAAVCDAVDRLHRAERVALRDLPSWCASPAPNGMACEALPEIQFKAGLECPVRPTQIRAQATPAQTRWHVERLLDGAAAPLGAPPADRPIVYLLDSGLHPDLRTGSARVEDFGESTFADPPGSDRLPHGSAMAGLVTALARFVELRSVRVFGTDGVARTDRLARALALAHRDMQAAPERTYLVNLSLGWPAEFALPTVLQGGKVRWDGGRKALGEGACHTLNEGVGESVRFVLARLAADDARGRLRATTLAAAGNLPPGEINLSRRTAELRGSRCGGKLPPQVVAHWIFQNLDTLRRDDALANTLNGFLRQAGGVNQDRFAQVLQDALGGPEQAEQAQALVDRAEQAVQLDAAWCRGGQALAPRPFLPAAWGLPSDAPNGVLGPLPIRQGPARAPGGGTCEPVDLALAVGAHDARDRLVYQHPKSVNPTLALPGQQVFAPAPDAPVLTDAEVSGCTGLATSTSAQPLPVSGTSAATALATGVAALAQAAIPDGLAARFGARARPGLDAARLKALLRLVGDDAGGQDPSLPADARSRRPSLCRLQKALTTCGPLSTDDVRCALGGGAGCTKFSANCDLSACNGQPGVPAAPANYPQGSCTPTPTVLPDPQPWASPCDGGADCLSGFEAGVLGPQPDDPMCEFCGVTIERPGAAAANPLMGAVTLEFGAGFPYAGHRVQNPRLLATLTDGGVKKGYFQLDLGMDTLYAGWSAKITDLKVHSLSDSTTAWKSADAYLVVDTVDLKTGKTRTRFEPVTVKINPP